VRRLQLDGVGLLALQRDLHLALRALQDAVLGEQQLHLLLHVAPLLGHLRRALRIATFSSGAAPPLQLAVGFAKRDVRRSLLRQVAPQLRVLCGQRLQLLYGAGESVLRRHCLILILMVDGIGLAERLQPGDRRKGVEVGRRGRVRFWCGHGTRTPL